MQTSVQTSNIKRLRKSFGKIRTVLQMPNLIKVQIDSYKQFLQDDIEPDKRKPIGLQSVFKSIFPITDNSGLATLDFVKYTFEEPKFDVEESKKRSINYAAPLKITMRLIIWEEDIDTGSKEIKSIKEQDVYLGDVPLMTKNGTFVINGVERVIVSQVHRSPGVFFDHDGGKTHSSGKFLYSARIIPYRGSWLDFEFDGRDLIYFRIDRKRKLLGTVLLRALGFDNQQILDKFYTKINVKSKKDDWLIEFIPDFLKGRKLVQDLVDAKGSVLIEKGTKITPRILKNLVSSGTKEYVIADEDLMGHYIASNIMDNEKVVLAAGSELTQEVLGTLREHKVSSFDILNIDYITVGPYIRNTLLSDKTLSREDALIDIYKVLRPGEPPNAETAEQLFKGLFFDNERYELSEVGRVKMNSRLDLNISEDVRILTSDDIFNILKLLVKIKDGHGETDDIDHLGNRRVRPVGELIENQFRIGLVRLERNAIERMASVDIDTIMPHDLVNTKLLGAVVREFFGTSQLSQFMDQTNPLSEITHKRRLSALGPGGLTRDRASLEVRDVHPTHYGRICPVETPEGQNIGLINSIATFARINKYGFIESPYRKVIDCKITDEVVYLSASEETKYLIAQANASIDDKGNLIDDLVTCRVNSAFTMAPKEQVQYIDVSPMQLVSVAAALIPFLENDDAGRTLMGSNMQRQAVPLIRTDAPLIGTGIEGLVAQDSGTVIVARRAGTVYQVDASRIVIRAHQEDGVSPAVDIYTLQKFQRSNYNTCINQKTLVRVGDVVEAGEVLADGPSTDKGELALGRNILVAFMPWNGYNFEDSILISKRIVTDDVFTSVHIEEFEVVARDTRLGPEEITRDIPNVSDENLLHLDEVGIVHIGAEVKAGDILVGKVTPKSETPMTPEEKLLKAIFGEKAADVRDSSLRLPPGVYGTVVEVRVFTRRGVEKDERALSIERTEIDKVKKDRDDELSVIEDYIYEKLYELLVESHMSDPKSPDKKKTITAEYLTKLAREQWWQIVVDNEKTMQTISTYQNQLKTKIAELDKIFKSKVERIQAGDDLLQGELKKVKVFIAVKHKLQPGDKMAGRHGNKGVISRILPVEDMPYLEDGTSVDMVLNPLGIPSRMNVGQVMETHLGWASASIGKQVGQLIDSLKFSIKNRSAVVKELRKEMKTLYTEKEHVNYISGLNDDAFMLFAEDLRKGIHMASPVFDGAKEHDIKDMLKKAGVSTSGQAMLYDGRTGEAFDRHVTIGIMYMLKLHHLVDEKIHARSIGPYSLVTQQPLGGRSHFGGQRFGEMECWALQAYGAAYTLQEMLTVKSDDVTGRIKMYESIVRGDMNFEAGIPESFHVMIKELRSLCLNVDMELNSLTVTDNKTSLKE